MVTMATAFEIHPVFVTAEGKSSLTGSLGWVMWCFIWNRPHTPPHYLLTYPLRPQSDIRLQRSSTGWNVVDCYHLWEFIVV